MITARLIDATAATPRTRLLRLQLDGRLTFTPGQAVLVGMAGSGVRAPYSIASAPGRHDVLELLIGAEGAFGVAARDPSTLVGATFDVDGPVGGFGVPEAAAAAPLLLVAGGTGIAPLRSILSDRLARGHAAPISVVYSARAADEFAFGDEFAALAAAGRITLHCTVTRDDPGGWEGRTGRIDDGLLAAAWPGDGAWSLVCGPAPFVSDVTAALARMGVDPARVVVER
ncbi:MAG: FAD-dependent oxidoreductase [Vicinamibacterales bacterium]